jgi:uncharacterized protein YdhG (YjbR/CyaY superfamily)
MYPIIGREKDLYAKELQPYLAKRATLQFPIGQPLPIGLVKKVVKERAKENEARATPKPAARGTKKNPPQTRRRARGQDRQ